jgi:hypothetical protein
VYLIPTIFSLGFSPILQIFSATAQKKMEANPNSIFEIAKWQVRYNQSLLIQNVSDLLNA